MPGFDAELIGAIQEESMLIGALLEWSIPRVDAFNDTRLFIIYLFANRWRQCLRFHFGFLPAGKTSPSYLREVPPGPNFDGFEEGT